MIRTCSAIGLVAIIVTLLVPSWVAQSQRGRMTIALSIHDEGEHQIGHAIKFKEVDAGHARLGTAPGGVLVRIEPVNEHDPGYRVAVGSKGSIELGNRPSQVLRPGSSITLRVSRTWPNGKWADLPYKIEYEGRADSSGVVQEYLSWIPGYRAEGRLNINGCSALIAVYDANGDGQFDETDFTQGTSIGLDRNGDGRIWGADELFNGDQIITYCGRSFVVAGIEPDGSALTLSETDLKVPKVGEPLPEVSLLTTGGKTIRSSDLKGRVVVLDFWASWCVPCVEKFGRLKELDKETRAQVDIIAINVDEERRVAAAREIIKDRSLTWNQVITCQGSADPVWKMFGSMNRVRMGIPLYVVVDRNGVLKYAGTGGNDLSELRGKVLQELEASRK